MVNMDDSGTIISTGLNKNSNKNIVLCSPKYQLNNLSKYFVKDILNVLESTDKKGKTKLKEIRSKMYGYLKRIN